MKAVGIVRHVDALGRVVIPLTRWEQFSFAIPPGSAARMAMIPCAPSGRTFPASFSLRGTTPAYVKAGVACFLRHIGYVALIF